MLDLTPDLTLKKNMFKLELMLCHVERSRDAFISYLINYQHLDVERSRDAFYSSSGLYL